MDAGLMREELVKKARMLMDGSTCSCYGELYEALQTEITDLSIKIEKPPGFVMACLVDDLQND